MHEPSFHSSLVSRDAQRKPAKYCQCRFHSPLVSRGARGQSTLRRNDPWFTRPSFRGTQPGPAMKWPSISGFTRPQSRGRNTAKRLFPMPEPVSLAPRFEGRYNGFTNRKAKHEVALAPHPEGRFIGVEVAHFLFLVSPAPRFEGRNRTALPRSLRHAFHSPLVSTGATGTTFMLWSRARFHSPLVSRGATGLIAMSTDAICFTRRSFRGTQEGVSRQAIVSTPDPCRPRRKFLNVKDRAASEATISSGFVSVGRPDGKRIDLRW